MNITYLLILLAVAINAIYWIRRLIKNPERERLLIPAIISLFAISVMTSVSLLGSGGTPITKVFPQGSFEIEQTPYRIIIRADGQERTFTDAYTVVRATQARPSSVRLTYYVNAWGIVHESATTANTPKVELLFAGDEKPEQSPTK